MKQQNHLFRHKLLQNSLVLIAAMLSTIACLNMSSARFNSTPRAPSYVVMIEASKPSEAWVNLKLPVGSTRVYIARNGDASAISQVRCTDGRVAAFEDAVWLTPQGCGELIWRVALESIDTGGMDASLPIASFSRNHSYWLLPERAAFLRATNDSARMHMILRLEDGRTINKNLTLSSANQPPLYAVIGGEPQSEYSLEGMRLRVFGNPPKYSWMVSVHNNILAQWSTWRRDIMTGEAPDTIDWVWVEAPFDAEPGYNASAGAETIVSQIKLRDRDPDGEAKSRVVIGTSAAHEGFHTITGAAGQAWPAWINESLASHFAIKAARTFLAPEDQKWLEAFYIVPKVHIPLLEAQASYSTGDEDQAQVFYTYGARFWREIESILTNKPNRSGRLAALIVESDNFSKIDLNSANELAMFLDLHSDGKARPIVLCFLLNQCAKLASPLSDSRS